MPDKELAGAMRPDSAPRRCRCRASAGPARSMRRAASASRMIVSTRSLSSGRRGAAPAGSARRVRSAAALPRLAGVPAALELIEADGRQVLVLERVPGQPLSRLELSWPDFALVQLRLLRLVWGLARRGVRHNDLRPENVMVAPDGRIHLVDFDQASTGGLLECLVAALGLAVGQAPVSNGCLRRCASASRRGFRPGSFARCGGDGPARRP